MTEKKNTPNKKNEKELSSDEISLMFYKLYFKINEIDIDEKIKLEIKKDISKIQKAVKVKELPNSTITVLKNLGVI